MADLEQTITEWRRQMLAAGVKTPAPLDELESHLREEIEHRMKSGFNEQRAFETAARQIGSAGVIENEFKKAQGIGKSISLPFINGVLVISGVASLAMLCYWFARPPFFNMVRFIGAVHSDQMSLLHAGVSCRRSPLLYQTFFVPECWALSLILTTLFALLRFRFRSSHPKHPAFNPSKRYV